MPNIGDKFYRFEERLYANDTDEFGESTGSHVEVELCTFYVTKVTPQGVWLGKRFVLLTANKKYALPTIGEANISFRKRKEKQISIYQSKISGIKQALSLLEFEQYREVQCQYRFTGVYNATL